MNNRALPTEMRSVPCERGTLTYLLTRKKVKNVNLRIKSDGRILVSANKRVSTAFIDDFVMRNQGYIFRTLERFQRMQERRREENPAPLKLYVSGEKIPLFGKYLTLKVLDAGEVDIAQMDEVCRDAAQRNITEYEMLRKVTVLRGTAPKEAVWSDGETLFLTVKDTENLKRKEKLINDWQKKLQEKTFWEICRKTYPMFTAYGVNYPQIKIRRMTSRWGSCQPAGGVITLNSRLTEAPWESIEYVVLHEFAHFVHPNHSKDFYALVGKLMPDFKERKAELPV